MTIRKFTLYLLGATLLFSGCSEKNTNALPTISVSIQPLRYLVEHITGDDFHVNVLVPQGASPETYEPTPAQMKELAQSQIYVEIGLLDFEYNLETAVQKNLEQVHLIDLSEGIALIRDDHEHSGHQHGSLGVDPHIWASPKNMRIMAETLYREIAKLYPDSIKYRDNYTQLVARIDSLDAQLPAIFEGQNRVFIIHHPALSYLARDYGLRQISLEYEGKEPSAEHIRSIIDTARTLGISRIFYQKQFSQNTVHALAKELSGEAIALDPLEYNLIENTLDMSRLIAQPE